MITQTTDIEPTPELSPELLVRLHSALEMHATLKQMVEAERETIQSILDESGVAKVKAGDWAVSMTTGGTSSSLDKKKLIAQGVTPAMIDAATTHRPKKPYLTIRKAGEREDSE